MQTIAQRQSDKVLVERYQFNGDESAFAELTRRYADPVFAASLRVLGDRALAEDVTQETFFRFFKQPHQVRESIGGWLHRVATRLSIDHLRSDRRRRREQAGARMEEANPASPAASWERIAPHIDAALDDLPQAHRDLLIAHFLHGRTLTELAGEQQVSKATLSRRSREALEQLRSHLAKRGVTIGAVMLGSLLAAQPASAAPLSLRLLLGKMALAGSTTPAGAGTIAVGSPPGGWMTWLLMGGAVGGCAVILLVLLQAVPWRPPESVESRAARAITFLAVPGGIAGSGGSGVSLLQHPDSAINGRISVVFDDGRVTSMTVHEASVLVERQTGQPFATLLNTLPPAAP